MYRIGEFSYLFKVTLKTLRHYDKIGLFSPKKVDEFAGYRYYDDSQVKEFKKILTLKELKFSLDDIKALKESATIEFLQEKLQEVNSDLSKSKQKINLLQEMLQIKGVNNMKYKVGFLENPKEIAIGRYVNLKTRDDMNNEFMKLFDELHELKNKAGIKEKIGVWGRLAVNEEIGYKEEDIEMFLGFTLSSNELDKYKDYLHILKENNFIVRKRGREPEGLAAVKIPRTDNISDVYSSIINYAKNNNIQIRGLLKNIIIMML